MPVLGADTVLVLHVARRRIVPTEIAIEVDGRPDVGLGIEADCSAWIVEQPAVVEHRFPS